MEIFLSMYKKKRGLRGTTGVLSSVPRRRVRYVSGQNNMSRETEKNSRAFFTLNPPANYYYFYYDILLLFSL